MCWRSAVLFLIVANVRSSATDVPFRLAVDSNAAANPVVYSPSFTQPTFMTRTAKLLLVPIVLLQVLVFTFIVRHRFIHVDEGFFLVAARLVLMGKKPYLDFFYPQAPLLPYIYALWMKCFGISWAAGRQLAALLTCLLGALVYGHVCRLTRNWLAGVAAVIVFVSSTLIFAWLPIVAPFSLAGLFIFAAYVVVSRLSAESPRWLIAAAGLLLGLSVDIRSYLLAPHSAVPVVDFQELHYGFPNSLHSLVLWRLHHRNGP